MKKINNIIEHKVLEDALLSFRRNLTQAIIEEANKRGYSLSHFEVLKYIGKQGSPTMASIASHLRITPPSASALIDVLVAKDLVVRAPNINDRRIVAVSLSSNAHVLLSSIYGQKDSIFTKMLSKLNSKDKDELARILIKCI